MLQPQTNMKIFAGNFPPGIDPAQVKSLFETHGPVLSMLPNPVTMGPACLRFIVEMSCGHGLLAVQALHGTMHFGLQLNVWESTQRAKRRWER